MDEIEHQVLSGIPVNSLNLTLTRAAIRMQQSQTWEIDKVNSDHELLICLEGRGEYLIEGDTLSLSPGDALLMPLNTRFIGRNPGPKTYFGVAQHFRLDLFGRHDLLERVQLRRKIHFSRWAMLEPLVRHYRASAPLSLTTMIMHHSFMVILNEFLEDAFLGWSRATDAPSDPGDGLQIEIVLAATRIAADPLQPGLAERVVADAPYNPDYFQREFRYRIGWTPLKFQEFKRMERAMHFLETGCRVAESAENVGYSDVYYFSRMFKRYIGTSPRGYQIAVQHSRDGTSAHGEEDGRIPYPLRHPSSAA